MSMKPGCVVYNPEGRNWCVMIETFKKDGSIRRFMSFHETQEVAQMVKDAHDGVYKDNPDVKISMFEYDYITEDQEIIARLISEDIEYLVMRKDND